MGYVNVKGQELFINDFLLQKLNNIKRIVRRNYDCVFLIDGKERIGKSTLGMTCAWYLSDGNFKLNYILKNSQDAINKIGYLPDKIVLMIDEGSMMFLSKDAMRKEQKTLLKILDVVGQKNIIFIVILPCFFDLSKTIALRRSKFLLHCYSDNQLNRGRFAYFGETTKQQLYFNGKKNFDSYSKPRADFVGRFLDFNPFGAEYLQIKKDTLIAALHEDDKDKDSQAVKYKNKMKKIVYNFETLYFLQQLSAQQKAKILNYSMNTYYEIKRDLIMEGKLPDPKTEKLVKPLIEPLKNEK